MKLKTFFNDIRILGTSVLLLSLSLSARAQDTNALRNLRSLTNTNALLSNMGNSAQKIRTNSVTLARDTNAPSSTPPQAARAQITGTGSADLGPLDHKTFAEDLNIGLPIGAYADSETAALISLLRYRLASASPDRPLEFRGQSTAGHEFILSVHQSSEELITPPNILGISGPPPRLEVEFRFDGDPTPIRSVLDLAYPLRVHGLHFRGLVRGSDRKTDPQSNVSVTLDYSNLVNRFELKDFALKMGPRSQPEKPEVDDETIVYGGLDSGGGGK